MSSENRFTRARAFYEKVMGDFIDGFVDAIQNRPVEKIGGWSAYFEWLECEHRPLSDLAVVEDWTEADCIKFIRAADVQSITAKMNEFFVAPSKDADSNRDLRVHDVLTNLASQAALAALQIELLLKGIDPSRVDDYVAWRSSAEFGTDIRREVFENCVIAGNAFPTNASSLALT